jgi:hypothetical protein
MNCVQAGSHCRALRLEQLQTSRPARRCFAAGGTLTVGCRGNKKSSLRSTQYKLCVVVRNEIFGRKEPCLRYDFYKKDQWGAVPDCDSGCSVRSSTSRQTVSQAHSTIWYVQFAFTLLSWSPVFSFNITTFYFLSYIHLPLCFPLSFLPLSSVWSVHLLVEYSICCFLHLERNLYESYYFSVQLSGIGSKTPTAENISRHSPHELR